MTPIEHLALLFVGAYLVGSIPIGLIVTKLKGVEIRTQGSGNVGATNVGRVLGRNWGLLVFSLDVAKGAAGTIAASVLMGPGAAGDASQSTRDWIWLGAGVCAVLGSVAPIFAGFRGGKGVATSLGAIMGVYPFLTWPALAALVIFALVVKATGYVSLGSIVAAWSMPVMFFIIAQLAGWRTSDHYPLIGLCLLLALVILLRHRLNLIRLWSGTENRVGKGSG